jgi:hypothetical protein
MHRPAVRLGATDPERNAASSAKCWLVIAFVRTKLGNKVRLAMNPDLMWCSRREVDEDNTPNAEAGCGRMLKDVTRDELAAAAVRGRPERRRPPAPPPWPPRCPWACCFDRGSADQDADVAQSRVGGVYLDDLGDRVATEEAVPVGA